MSRHVAIAAGLAVTGVVAGNVFLVAPADRQTRATYEQVAELRPLIATAPVHTARLHDLGHALDELGGRVRNICRHGASGGDADETIDDLHRAISVPDARVRGVETHPERRLAEGHGPMVVPLTVDLEGSFEAIFEVLRRVEAIPHSVEVVSVSIEMADEGMRDRSPMLTATIDLDLLSARAPLEYPQ